MFIRPLPSSPPACLSQRWRVDCCPLLWWGPPCYTWAGKIPLQPGCVPIPIPVQERLIKQQHIQHAQNWHIYCLVFSSLSLSLSLSIIIPSCLLLSGRNLLALWTGLRRLDSRPHPSHVPERRQLTFFLSYVSLTAYWFLRFPSTFPAKEIWIILQLLYESGFPALYLFVSRSYCGVFFPPASPAIVQPSGTKSRETLWSTIRDRISNLLRISLFFGQHRKKICRSPGCYFVYVYLSLFTNSMHDQKFQKRQPKTKKKNGTNHYL